MSSTDSTSERREDAVRVRAYLLWEQAGRPDGQDLELWLQAEAEVGNFDDPADAFAGGSAACEENRSRSPVAAVRPSAVAPAGAPGPSGKGKAAAKQSSRVKKSSGAGRKTASAVTKRKGRTASPSAADGAVS